MRELARPLAVLLSACGLAGCGPSKEPPAAWREVPEASLTAPQQAQRERADGARKALFEGLMARLSAAMGSGGPAAAIPVCKEDAPRLAAEVAAAKGLRIGRTSFHLRNPGNAPPAWAEPLVAARRDRPTFLAHGDGRLAVLQPIRLLPTCVVCHGEANALEASVREALAKDYPSDRATGFRAGDLRGWFWIEVP